MSLGPNLINVSFSLQSGTFGDSGGNTANLSGYRVSCSIETFAGYQNANARVAIYGLSLSMMNQLTTLGSQLYLQAKNGMQIFAGSAGGAMSLVFQGNIFNAWVDANAQPQVCLRVDASPGAFYNAMPQTPLSFSGATPATTVAKQIAGYLGVNFVNNGVTAVLSNPYFSSDAISMLQKLSEHAGFEYVLEKGTLTITAAGSNSGKTVQIAPPQMVKYPSFVSNQVIVESVFNPNINVADLMQITSSLTAASGTWKIFKKAHDIESKVPHGKWFSKFWGNPTTDTTTPQS